MQYVSDLTDRKSRRRHQSRARRDDRRRRDPMTIDELARRTRMTARNIRAHQSRGLLPPPEVRGRTGYYRREHLDRLELIKELQADGFNLEAIRKLIAGAKGSTSEVLRFTRALRAPFEEEEPEIVEGTDLAKRFAGNEETGPDPALLARAIELGVLRHLGEGRFEVRSPRLSRAGAELVSLGIPTARGLDVVEDLRRNADGVAQAFVELFVDEIWNPFVEAGRPEERWPDVLDALERLRPLATDALVGVFQILMTERVEERFGQVLEGMAGEAPESEDEEDVA
jgi:DNA-binding transcriptional MerR regulator